MAQALFDVCGDKEDCSVAKMFLVFGKEDIDTGKVEVTKVNITIGNGLQPRAQVGGLWVA